MRYLGWTRAGTAEIFNRFKAQIEEKTASSKTAVVLLASCPEMHPSWGQLQHFPASCRASLNFSLVYRLVSWFPSPYSPSCTPMYGEKSPGPQVLINSPHVKSSFCVCRSKLLNSLLNRAVRARAKALNPEVAFSMPWRRTPITVIVVTQRWVTQRRCTQRYPNCSCRYSDHSVSAV